MSPKVCIGVVTYNHAPFIAACLDSIHAQNYPNIEVIVCDDASQDETLQVIEAWRCAHPGFVNKVIAHPKNIGIARNFNAALDHFTPHPPACRGGLGGGDYLCIFAGDDLMLPGKIAAQVVALEKHPEAVLCFTNMEWFWSDSGRKICNHFGLLQRPSTRLADIVGENTVPSPTLLFRRSAIRNLRFKENLRYINDFFFVVEAMLRGRALYVPIMGVRYRKHAGSTTLRHYFYRDRLRALSLLKKVLPPEYAPAIARFARTVDYARVMTLIQIGKKRRAIKEFIRLAPAAFLSPKWALRVGAVAVKLLMG